MDEVLVWVFGITKELELSPCYAQDYLYVDLLKFHLPLPSQASDTLLKCQAPHMNDDDERTWHRLLLKSINQPTNQPTNPSVATDQQPNVATGAAHVPRTRSTSVRDMDGSRKTL